MAAPEDQLLRLALHLAVVAPHDGVALLARVGQRGHPVGEVVPLRRVQGGAQLVVAVALLALDAPLAAVVDAGHAAHGEEQPVERLELALVVQFGRDARHVVVVDKVEQVLARVEVPGPIAALTLQRVGHLVHVRAVEARPEALVGLVVGHRVAQAVAHPLVVVAKHGLTHQDELLAALPRDAVGNLAQVAKVSPVKAVGHVQAQAVDAKVAHPTTDDVGQVVIELEVAVVELHERGDARPGLVAEAVAELAVAAPVDVEPAGIAALLAPLTHVTEGKELSAHVVEDAVEQHADARLVARIHNEAQVVVGAQAAVHGRVVRGVIAVREALEDGVEHEAGCPEASHVVDPAAVDELAQARHHDAVVLVRGAAQPQRIDLVDKGWLVPAHRYSSRRGRDARANGVWWAPRQHINHTR